MLTILVIVNIICRMTITSVSAKPSAPEILHRMAQTYASCKSYQDTGTVTNTFDASKSSSWTSITHFNTTFARPLRFRFEFTSRSKELDDNTHYIMWTSNNLTYTWWNIEPKVRKEESFDMAIAGATGISSKAAHTVPRLLLPNKVSGWVLSSLQNPSIMLSEKIDGRICYKIDSYDRGRMVSVWIDKQDYLIRKIVEMTPKFDIMSTTIYHPSLNKNIPAQAFKSRVPK